MDFPHGRFRKRKFGHGKKKRVRPGDARAAVLVLLDEQPMHGYQIIQEIEERSSGFWKPSPGSVYPVLQQLEDEGLVLIEQTEGRRVVSLTEAGRSYVEDNRTELEGAWNAVINPVDEAMIDVRNLFSLSKQIFIATKQVAQVGTDRQLTEAKKVLTDTRRRLYLILAEDEAGGEQDAGGATRAWRLAETLEKKDQQNARTSVAAVAAALPAHRKCFLQNQLLPFSLTVG